MTKLLKSWGVSIVLGLLLALMIREFLFFVAYVPSISMEPTISAGERLFVTRTYNHKRLKRGDLIVFKFPETDEIYIKRLIGLPGDAIKIESGSVFINGKDIVEPYVINKDSESYFTDGVEVPKDSFFFLGDNRNESYDSRFWGEPFIKKEDIIGKAVTKIFPFMLGQK